MPQIRTTKPIQSTSWAENSCCHTSVGGRRAARVVHQIPHQHHVAHLHGECVALGLGRDGAPHYPFQLSVARQTARWRSGRPRSTDRRPVDTPDIVGEYLRAEIQCSLTPSSIASCCVNNDAHVATHRQQW